MGHATRNLFKDLQWVSSKIFIKILKEPIKMGFILKIVAKILRDI